MQRLVAKINRDDDGSYWAEVEGLPGCFASGESIEELLEALQEAASLYLAKPGEPPADVPPFTVTSVETHVAQPA